jgi:hypothetical protein
MELPEGGIWYHPRSLWSVAQVDFDQNNNNFVSVPRNDLRNGTRWPITVNRIALAVINDPIQRSNSQPEDFPNAAEWVNATTSFLAGTQIRYSMPFRKGWSRQALFLGSLSPRPSTQPQPRKASGSPAPFASTTELFGQTHLTFDKPLYLPRMGSISYDVSGLGPQLSFDPGGGGDPAVTPNADIPCFQYWHEAGGLFEGSARVNRGVVRTDPSGTVVGPNEQGWPYLVPSGWSTVVTPGAKPVPFFGGGNPQFDGGTFNKQESTRDGSTHLTGVGMLLDQLDYDRDLLASIENAGMVAEQQQITPLSTRVGTRIRLVNGPSTDWWWRPGAPACLVFDSITPAVVYDLPEPITLQGGDSLQLDLVPAGTTNPYGVGGSFGQVDDFPSRLNIGISLNGYAAIEG